MNVWLAVAVRASATHARGAHAVRRLGTAAAAWDSGSRAAGLSTKTPRLQSRARCGPPALRQQFASSANTPPLFFTPLQTSQDDALSQGQVRKSCLGGHLARSVSCPSRPLPLPPASSPCCGNGLGCCCNADHGDGRSDKRACRGCETCALLLAATAAQGSRDCGPTRARSRPPPPQRPLIYGPFRLLMQSLAPGTRDATENVVGPLLSGPRARQRSPLPVGFLLLLLPRVFPTSSSSVFTMAPPLQQCDISSTTVTARALALGKSRARVTAVMNAALARGARAESARARSPATTTLHS